MWIRLKIISSKRCSFCHIIQNYRLSCSFRDYFSLCGAFCPLSTFLQGLSSCSFKHIRANYLLSDVLVVPYFCFITTGCFLYQLNLQSQPFRRRKRAFRLKTDKFKEKFILTFKPQIKIKLCQ